MKTGSSTRPYGIAMAAGAVLWIATALIGGRGEPWDVPGYWTVAYPLAIALAGLLGYAFPVRPWRWAAVVMLMQVVVMLFGSSGFGLLPAGLLLLTVLTLPAIALAQLAAWVRRRADG